MTAVPLVLAVLAGSPDSSSIVNSKHNLSASGPGTIKSTDESEICKFCHISHGAAKGRGLNARPDPRGHTPYASSTMRANASSEATGASRVCLSCHDGTIALGQIRRGKQIRMANAGPNEMMPLGSSNLGTDLSDHHPFSFRPLSSAKLRSPTPDDSVKLDHQGMIQCTSCHDPHREDADPVEKKFLVKGNRGSALCLSCHVLPEWGGSLHQTSPVYFDKSHGASTAYQTVSDNGCESCHKPHGAPGGKRLQKGVDEQVCLSCHSGRVAKTDIARQLAKLSSHQVTPATGQIHEPSEGPFSPANPLPETRQSTPRHATCADCHNAHAIVHRRAEGAQVAGALNGVWGIDRNGLRVEQVRFEYEVCFKCHGDSANQPQARGLRSAERLRRAVTEVNLRRAFDPASPSYHPVVAPGRGTDVPSLLPPWTTASTVTCTDCHNSDDGPAARAPVASFPVASVPGAGVSGSNLPGPSIPGINVPRIQLAGVDRLEVSGLGARGPHGSSNAHLLERRLETADNTPESPESYALCYKCHSRDVLLSGNSAFKSHRRHVVDKTTPCTACHGAHGVSVLQGNPANNAHLIDFDISIVRPSKTGEIRYQSRGFRSGSCTLSCHGANHVNTTYPD